MERDKTFHTMLCFIGLVIILLSSYIFQGLYTEGFSEKDLRFYVMGIFKNEAMGIREWVEHYKWQGADGVLLLNNESTDNWKEKLNGLESFATVLDAPGAHKQAEHYNKIGLPWLKEHKVDVVAVLDLDEFLFRTDGQPLRTTIQSVFGQSNRPPGFLCLWHLFGSSGHVEQPESIRKGFIHRKKDRMEYNGKSILWVDDIEFIQLHDSNVKDGKKLDTCPSELQFNHYVIQSREFFEKIKMTRGDAFYGNSTHRTWEYFDQNDFKDVEDTLLKKFVEES
jgi:hypothetical protein